MAAAQAVAALIQRRIGAAAADGEAPSDGGPVHLGHQRNGAAREEQCRFWRIRPKSCIISGYFRYYM